MSLHGLLDAVTKDPALEEAVAAAADGNRHHVDLVGPAAARPFAVAALARSAGRPVLAVTATGREAEDLGAALRSLLPEEGVVEYPSWETLPHERLSPRSDTVGRRLAVLRRLAHPEPDDPATGPVSVVVAPIRSVLQPQVKGLGELVPVALKQGQSADLDEVVDALSAAAYARVELVGEARRLRGPRRHPGRLPAHRGAPAPGGVLGRRGGGGPLLQGGRPALAGDRGARAVGSAVP